MPTGDAGHRQNRIRLLGFSALAAAAAEVLHRSSRDLIAAPALLS